MDRSLFRPRAVWIGFCGLLQFLFTGGLDGQAATVGVKGAPRLNASRCVVLVHGIHDSAKCMGQMKRFLESRGWEVHAISFRPNDASISFEAMGRQLEAFVKANVPEGRKFDLVGFSMGGLVSRYYVQKMDGYRRVRRFVTLSTPNHGTLWAYLSGRPGVREMRPGSALLRELNADAGRLSALDYTSIYTPLDLTIVPSGSSKLPGARNVVQWVPLHALMVCMPGPIHAVGRALE